MGRDYYETLGVGREASEKEIRDAFRRLARQHHPDVNPDDEGAEGRFKEVNEAYQTLSHAESRRKYDRYGEGWEHAEDGRGDGGPSPFTWFSRAQGRSDGRGGGFGGSRGSGSGGIGEFLGGLFGGQGGEGLFERRRYDVPARITLEEAYRGTTLSVQLPPEGDGGGGKRLEVGIPAGVESGSRVHVGVDGGRADVNVLVTVAPHGVFTRDGANLLTTVDVPLVDAALGGEVKAPLITGRRVALTIPPETQNGRSLRLRGKGMPRRGGSGYGDLLVTARVVLPTGLTDEQRAAFERLRELDGERASGR